MAPLRAYYGRTLCERRAQAVLDGFGDAAAGEWREWSGKAYHLRRRLTITEQDRVGPAIDIRRTPEAVRRAGALGPRLAVVPADILDYELGPQV